MQVTKGTWRMRKQCIPGSLSSSPAQEPGNEATTAYVCAVRVTIFSTSGKFQPVSNFTELHALTLAARCYVLLVSIIRDEGKYLSTDLFCCRFDTSTATGATPK